VRSREDRRRVRPREDPLGVRAHAANILAGGGQRRRARRQARVRQLASAIPAYVWERPDSPPAKQFVRLIGARFGLSEDDDLLVREALLRLVPAPRQPTASSGALDDFALREAAGAAAEEELALAEAVRPMAERAGLSPLEEAVLLLDAQGLTHRAMAERLGLAEGTTKSALHRARRKVGAQTQRPRSA
jgi:DNA-directed RNA polymerase specialized sigma24 family protein